MKIMGPQFRSKLILSLGQAIAVVGMGVLLFSHFPSEGSELCDEFDEDATTAAASEASEEEEEEQQ